MCQNLMRLKAPCYQTHFQHRNSFLRLWACMCSLAHLQKTATCSDKSPNDEVFMLFVPLTSGSNHYLMGRAGWSFCKHLTWSPHYYARCMSIRPYACGTLLNPMICLSTSKWKFHTLPQVRHGRDGSRKFWWRVMTRYCQWNVVFVCMKWHSSSKFIM